MKRITNILIIALFLPLTIQAQDKKNVSENDCSQLEIDAHRHKGGIMIWIARDSSRCQKGWRLPTPEEAICMCQNKNKRNNAKYGKWEKSDWYWTNHEINEEKAYAI